MAKRGMFIVFEGPDSCGKSTASKAVAQRLVALWTSEPTDGQVGVLTRARSVELSPDELALLFTADRMVHVRTVIEPALASGRDVVCDRYKLSTYVYQLAMNQHRSDERSYAIWLTQLNQFALNPDLYVLLRVSPEEAARRMESRGKAREIFEQEEVRLRVHALYDRAHDFLRASQSVSFVYGERSEADVAEACLETIANQRARLRSET